MRRIVIDSSDIFLDDLGDGKGKITISNTYGYNFSYYWGCMGCSLREFLLSVNSDYFIRKLAPNPEVYCPVKTAKSVRRHVRKDLSYELPWYKHMEFQKGLREWIKGIEDTSTEYEFVDYCYNILNDYRIDIYSVDRQDRADVESLLKSVFETEPWYFIEKTDSGEAIFLSKLFVKLKKVLKK